MVRRRVAEPGTEQARSGPELPADWAAEPVLLGCHRGAGATTFRVLLATPWDLGAYTPERGTLSAFGRPLVLVTRVDAISTTQTMGAANLIRENRLHCAALVLVADAAGSEPPEVAASLRVLEDAVGSIVRFPFVPALVHVDSTDADQVRLPRKAKRALTQIRNACEEAARAHPAGAAPGERTSGAQRPAPGPTGI
ncbi:hypothetical protein F4561_001955 [Lipingzhangella halophila]|uniref:Uncharacterized protein n=1 Tax=Lipingzhangella halophila TaxID=1783352 RepID=A0A7W7RFR8_9ACTN|nr:hypothetical protein [Lipingzhangella halophila]MBB4931135.1 hypothetical protein [Lipingzhangella halophila]